MHENFLAVALWRLGASGQNKTGLEAPLRGSFSVGVVRRGRCEIRCAGDIHRGPADLGIRAAGLLVTESAGVADGGQPQNPTGAFNGLASRVRVFRDHDRLTCSISGTHNRVSPLMIGLTTRSNNILGALYLALCLLALGFAIGVAFHKYVGVSQTLAFLRSPTTYLRGHRRDWNSFELTRYTQDDGGLDFRRYVKTGLLPVVIDGKRLSDSYPVPKFAGAITVMDRTVVILDRVGGLYRYDLTTGSSEPLRTRPLPSNLEAYLQRPDLRMSNGSDEFRAHGITFLSDRKELAVAYDKFDAALGKLRTAVSVIPIDVTTIAATGTWRQIFVSDAYAPGSASG
jgi:hypothetical protein